MTNIFFVLNQSNYARWSCKYFDDLINFDQCHEGLKADFEAGSFSIRRTANSFCARPMDFIMETTHNANAANTMKAVVNMKHDLSQRHRWAKLHGTKTYLESHYWESIGKRKKENISNELQRSSIVRSHSQVSKMVDTFLKHINPFSAELHEDALFNIATGEVTSQNVANFLVYVERKRAT